MDGPDLSKVPADVATVAERARLADWVIEWHPREDTETPTLIINVPNGRNARRLVVGRERAAELLKVPFEKYRLLEEYLAIDNRSESHIEVLVRPPSRNFQRLSLQRLPGVELLERASPNAVEDRDLEEFSDVIMDDPVVRPGDRWQLRIERDQHSFSAEFSEISAALAALVSYPGLRALRGRRPGPATLKLYGVKADRHDDAVRLLESIGGAILFELDLRYGVLLDLVRHADRRRLRSYRREPTSQPPSFPRFRYPPEALSLYTYGRSASGMPLLQYLAFYQVLEFFFPQYSRQHVLRRLRQELVDPRFDVGDETHLARVLTIASVSGRGYGTEREQLKATLAGCTDEATLRDFITEESESLAFLGDKKAISGVPVIDLANRNSSLLDQVAERIYALRCRIVHTKADAGDFQPNLLLPGSSGADALATDVDVLQFLAQKAIIASGSVLR